MTEHLRTVVAQKEAEIGSRAAKGASPVTIPSVIPPPPGSSEECQLCYLEQASVYLMLVDWCIQFAPDPQHCVDEVRAYYLSKLDDCPCHA